MHKLIQDMRREIVYQESDEAGEHSRLWHYGDAFRPRLIKRKAPTPGALFSSEMEVSSEIQVEADQLLDESPEIMNSRKLEIVLAEGEEIRILEGEGYMGNKSDDEVKINEEGE
ncbi:hypothetical protein LguiB_021720 [Lonicera macranthoides]